MCPHRDAVKGTLRGEIEDSDTVLLSMFLLREAATLVVMLLFEVPSQTRAFVPSALTTPSSRLFFQELAGDEDEVQAPPLVGSKDRANTASFISLQEQAQQLRQEADAMRCELERQKAASVAKRRQKIDGWIEQLLISVQVDDRTQLLKSEDEVLRRLKEDRFSQEQVTAIFNRLCEVGSESRSSCSPLMELLVDSVGKMDELDRCKNPNKRWSGKVERILRRRLFAMDWNMDIEDDDQEDSTLNPWKLR